MIEYRRRVGSVETCARTVLLAVGVATMLACGSFSPDLSHLETQGEAGKLVRRTMDAHGGLGSFLALTDVEYSAVIERYDEVGVLQATARELHRFAAAPPRRYVLRRGTARVAEMGLLGDRVWTRLDGVLIDRPEAAIQAQEELTVLSVLNRAPFGLADPGLTLRLLSPTPATADSPTLERLVMERGGRDGGEPDRFVFLINADTALIHAVIFRTPQPGSAPPLRVARVEETRTVAGVLLVTRWAMAPADTTGRAVRVRDTLWSAAEAHTDNGFTDELYLPAGAGGS